MGFVVVIAGVAFLIGLVLRRWWLMPAVGALAAAHAAWLLLTGYETSESTSGELLVFSVAFLYPPALIGAFAGIMVGRLVRVPRAPLDR